MRRNPSTVVVLAGQPQDKVLSAIAKSLNVVLVRPDGDAPEGEVEAAVWALRRAAGISAPYVLVTADPLAAVAAEWRAMWEITAPQPHQLARGATDFELRAAEALTAWRANQFELPDYYLVLADFVLADEAAASGSASASAPAGAPTAPGTGPHRGDPHHRDPHRGGPHHVDFHHGGPAGAAASVPGTEAGPRPDFYLGPLRSVRPHRVAVVAPDPARSGESGAQAAALLSELGSLRHGPWWPSLDEILRTARAFYPGSLGESHAGQATLLG